MKKDNLVYLKHILDSISNIFDYTKDVTYDNFINNKLIQAGVMREIEIIGEASKRLTPEFKEKHSDIPWKQITGMRDKLIHDYFGVDLDAVWDTVQKDIPSLNSKIKELL